MSLIWARLRGIYIPGGELYKGVLFLSRHGGFRVLGVLEIRSIRSISGQIPEYAECMVPFTKDPLTQGK